MKIGFLETAKIPVVMSSPRVFSSIPMRQESLKETKAHMKMMKAIITDATPMSFAGIVSINCISKGAGKSRNSVWSAYKSTSTIQTISPTKKESSTMRWRPFFPTPSVIGLMFLLRRKYRVLPTKTMRKKAKPAIWK